MNKMIVAFLMVIALASCATVPRENPASPNPTVSDIDSVLMLNPGETFRVLDYAVYHDEDSVYIEINYIAAVNTVGSVFIDGAGYKGGNIFPVGSGTVYITLDRSVVGKTLSCNIWFSRVDPLVAKMPYNFGDIKNVNISNTETIGDRLYITAANEIDFASIDEFLAVRPWIAPSTVLTENVNWDMGSPWSGRYTIIEDTDIPFVYNEEYVGEWKFYGDVNNVNLSFSDINPESIFLFWKLNGEIGSFADMPSVVFSADGTYVGEHGNRWTDGFVIDDAKSRVNHALIYTDSETGITYLFRENKHEAFDIGIAPEYLVYVRK